MSNSLSKSLSKLRLSAQRLNQLTDQANKTIREVENFLNEECSVGVFASVIVSEHNSEDDIFTLYTCLQYRRVGQRFRIAIATGFDDGSENETVKPWSDSSRDEKLDSIAKLPDLVAQIGEKLDERIVNAEKGLGEVSEVLHGLSGKKGG